MADFGLGFLFEVQKDLVLNSEFIHTLYRVIARIIGTKAREPVSVPDMPGPDADGNEPSDDDKQIAQKVIEDAQRANADIERLNAEINAIHSKVKIAHRPHLGESAFPEVAIMRVSNYREPKNEDSTIMEANKSSIDLKLSATGEQ